MNKNSEINKWFEEIISSFHPDDQEAFKVNLIKGLMENNQDLINLALDELIGEESDLLNLKIQDLKMIFSDPNIHEDIEKILLDQKESKNEDLRKLLIEAKLSKNIDKVSEYVKKKILNKKVKFFNEFLQTIALDSSKESEGKEETSKETSLKNDKEKEKISKPFEEKKCLEFAKKTPISEDKKFSKIDPGSKMLMKNFFVIYETFEDASSEYKMNKIKFNLDTFEILVNNLIKKEGYEIVGFYGDLEKIFKIIKNSFYLEISMDNLRDYLFKNKIKECVIAITNGEKILLIFITTPNLYCFSNKAESNHLITIYLRFLIDLCRNIFYIPPLDFKLNPDNSTPFSDKVNRGLQMIEKFVDPSDKIKFDEISLIENKKEYLKTLNLKSFTCCSDSSKFLTKADLKIDEFNEINKQEVNYEDIHMKYDQYGYSNYGSHKFKKLDYNEIKSDIKKYWVETDFYFTEDYFPRKFEHKARELFKKFINHDFYWQLEKTTSQYQDLYYEQKAQIEEDFKIGLEKTNQIISSYLDEIVNFLRDRDCKNFPKILEEKKEKGFIEKTVNFFGLESKSSNNKNDCSKQCKQMTIYTIKYMMIERKYPHIDWSYLERLFGGEFLRLHRNKKSVLLEKKFVEINKKIEKTKKDFAEMKQENLRLLRTKLLDSFFDELENMILKKRIYFEYSYSFRFQSINMIRNAAHELENWNINQAPFVLHHKFGKDTNRNVFLKRIYFLEENCGIILFAHSPENKSSLLYFNVSNKLNPLMSPIMNLCSHDCDLIIDRNLNLWCVYTNIEKRFNMGKIQGTNFEDGLPIEIYDIWREGSIIKDIISASFLHFSDSIFIINQDFEFFELKYISKSLSLVWKKENKGSEGVVKTKILPKIEGEKYCEIQCTYEGKNIILRSKSTVDIYDLTWSCIYSIPIKENFISFKTLNDKINTFLIFVYEEYIKCFHFIGLTATRTVDVSTIGKKDQPSTGNPFIDYLYFSFKKFGPHSSFIGSPINTKLFLIHNLEEKEKNNLEKYFDQLCLKKVSLEILNEDEGNKILESKSPHLKFQVLKAIIISRVPLHIATIENFTLVPLQNGKNISDQIAENIETREKNHDLINMISQIIKFGSYEEFLKNYKGSIKVVSIVGRQSSGKSYVMNRFFGTRFNVASTRCTDGIWLSMSVVWINETESVLFVLMDCEGLFSARRNDQEEMKLGLNLAAVSDVMILNQDLAFNRYLNQLFTNFSKGIGRIKGKKLFKGYLLMLIRDVKSEEADGAYKELMANMAPITSKEKNFLNSLFQGKLKSQCLNYFEQPIFSEEIEWIRNEYFLLSEENRWSNGRDFLESSKIALAQIFVDDDTDMDLHKMNITCEHLFKECLKAFYTGDGFLKEVGLFYSKDFDFTDQTFNIRIKQEDIAFKLEISEEEKKEDVDFYPAYSLLTAFADKTCEYTRKIHNEWFLNFSVFLETFLKERMDFVIKHFEDHFKDENEFKSVLVNNLSKLTSVLSSFSNKIKFCTKKCRKCDRICQSYLNHIGDCDCKTDHRCEANCLRSVECKNNKYLCLEMFGHEGEHRCGEGRHMCDHSCDIEEGKFKCINLCGYESGHKEPGIHNCKNSHPCPEECQDTKCKRSCKYDLMSEHKFHECGENKCIHRCFLCDSQCTFNNHLHDQLINEGDVEKMYLIENEEKFLLNYHICEKEHYCGETTKKNCEQKGVCQVDFNVMEKIWKGEFSEFNYTYYQPKDSRLLCSLWIPKFLRNHKEAHKCSLVEPHRCSHQCPECKSFCSKSIDHDGLHSTKTHRNKENSVFISTRGKEKIEIQKEGKIRVFKSGEECKPENCSSSCARRGRAHFHLKECPGGDKCMAKIHSFVKHSLEKYHPFVDKTFDQWLCKEYWNSNGWDIPLEEKICEECNYVCGHYSHKDEYSFCSKKAWHEGSHTFSCKHEETYSSSIIDIVFCMDTTGSMGSYIGPSKRTINKIMNLALAGSSERSIRFGFVAYRDHPPEDTSYVTRVQGICMDREMIAFIDTVTASGGGDGPEAVLDGIYDSIHKMAWRKDSLRYLFHIADAPPHGKEYTGGSGDGFPRGCPCKININSLAENLKSNNIRYKLLKIGSYANNMASIFKSKIANYEESDLDSAIQLEGKVTDIIVRDIKTEDIDYFRE